MVGRPALTRLMGVRIPLSQPPLKQKNKLDFIKQVLQVESKPPQESLIHMVAASILSWLNGRR